MSGPEDRAPRWAAITGVLSIAGLAIATVLTWDHFIFLASPEGAAGVCGDGSGCGISRTSPLSELRLAAWLPGVPLSLIGAAAYVAHAVLAVMGRRPGEHGAPARRLTLGLAAGSTAFSAFLAVYSLDVQGTLCPWCAGLYVVNVGLLGAAIWGLGEPLRHGARGVFGDLLDAPAFAAALVFALTLGGGYGAYAFPLRNAAEFRQARQIASVGTVFDTPAVTLGHDVAHGARPFHGPDAAAGVVTLVEVADFQCPYCKDFFTAVEALQAARPDRLRVGFRHFPLDSSCNPHVAAALHPVACQMAVAAECAHREGRFFAMAAWLFDNARGVDVEALIDGAEAVGLDRASFRACLSDPTATEAVVADIEAAFAAGVKATPTFFVDGHRVEGGMAPPVLEALVDAAEARRQGGD